ncbi:MAG: transcriptional repressor [Pseudomonadota bacterium]
MHASTFHDHDHNHCIEDGLAAVEARCAAARLKLTAQRRRVLEILLTGHKALGAYEILDVLRADGHAAQPPVAYRALDFLVKHGFAHKVERLNAFVACAHPGEDHAPVFLICRTCKSVAETPSDGMRDVLKQTANEMGFALQATAIEAVGECPICSGAAE